MNFDEIFSEIKQAEDMVSSILAELDKTNLDNKEITSSENSLFNKFLHKAYNVSKQDVLAKMESDYNTTKLNATNNDDRESIDNMDKVKVVKYNNEILGPNGVN